MTVGSELVARFGPALRPFGFEPVEHAADRATFSNGRVEIRGRYVPRDGELSVLVAPLDGGDAIQLLLYLRSNGSGSADRLGDAVAESEAQAIEHVALFAESFGDAAPLLRGEPEAIVAGRQLRWWDLEMPRDIH